MSLPFRFLPETQPSCYSMRYLQRVRHTMTEVEFEELTVDLQRFEACCLTQPYSFSIAVLASDVSQHHLAFMEHLAPKIKALGQAERDLAAHHAISDPTVSAKDRLYFAKLLVTPRR